MDVIHGWIDEEKVKRLGADLSVRPEGMKAWTILSTAAESTVSDAAVEMAQEVPAEPSSEMKQQRADLLAQASAKAKSSGLLGATAVVASTVSVAGKVHQNVASLTASQPLLDTTNAPAEAAPHGDAVCGGVAFTGLCALLRNDPGSEQFCVIDHDGDVLYDNFKNKVLTQFASNIIKPSALFHLKEQEYGLLKLKVSASENLQFLAVKTTRGTIVTAMILNKSLSTDESAKLAQAIQSELNR